MPGSGSKNKFFLKPGKIYRTGKENDHRIRSIAYGGTPKFWLRWPGIRKGGLPFFGKRELFRLRERKESGLILITEYNLYGVLFGVYETIME